MPRASLIRSLLLFVAAGFGTLLLVWFALPSLPNVRTWSGNDDHYFENVLRTGGTLTSIYNNEPIYDSTLPNNVHDRDCFAIDWQIIKDEEKDLILLRINGATSLDLTTLASINGTDEEYSTDPGQIGILKTTARSGTYGGIMMSWFENADACLLNWELKPAYREIQMRAFVIDVGEVVIWPESTHWYKFPLETPDWQSKLKPFLTISNIPTTGNRTDISRIEVDHITYNVPSRTIRIRRLVLRIVGPVLITAIIAIGDFLYHVLCISLKIAMAYPVIVLGWWLICGRQPFDTWARKSLITKWMFGKRKVRVIWGPGGKVCEVYDDEHDKRDADLKRLQSPLDFFRSRSPLDDLLNSFEATRWMTQPITRPRDRNRSRFDLENNRTITITEDGLVKQGG